MKRAGSRITIVLTYLEFQHYTQRNLVIQLGRVNILSRSIEKITSELYISIESYHMFIDMSIMM